MQFMGIYTTSSQIKRNEHKILAKNNLSTKNIKSRIQVTVSHARKTQTMNGHDEDIYANMMKINFAPIFPS